MYPQGAESDGEVSLRTWFDAPLAHALALYMNSRGPAMTGERSLPWQAAFGEQ